MLDSAGDIRFDQATSPTQNTTSLTATGNVTLQGAQIYPATEAVATVTAGELATPPADSNTLAGGTLTILGQGGVAPDAPYSAGGTLSLFADTIVQDGVVRAPEGVINLGEPRGDGAIEPFTDSVVLAPGSITSVSLAGQTVPYGGTVDGVNYLFAGEAPLIFNPLIQIASASVDVQTGATIDLRGGGTLSGAAFIAGRGGSADVNLTPLLQTGTGTVVANTTDPVFAIVPGTQSQYAPVAPGDAGYGTPGEGEQITIRAGEVAGLAAGTYTLLPAYYDLLPGAYRVELTGVPMAAGTSGPFGNFTTEAAVTLGIANTGVAAAVPTEALITSGAGVRQLSQYNEESYNAFEVAQAAAFGAPRPLLPQDAKTLVLSINTPDMVPAPRPAGQHRQHLPAAERALRRLWRHAGDHRRQPAGDPRPLWRGRAGRHRRSERHHHARAGLRPECGHAERARPAAPGDRRHADRQHQHARHRGPAGDRTGGRRGVACRSGGRRHHADRG